MQQRAGEILRFSMGSADMVYFGVLHDCSVFMKLWIETKPGMRLVKQATRFFASDEEAYAFMLSKFKAFGPGITRLGSFQSGCPPPIGHALDFMQGPPREWFESRAA